MHFTTQIFHIEHEPNRWKNLVKIKIGHASEEKGHLTLNCKILWLKLHGKQPAPETWSVIIFYYNFGQWTIIFDILLKSSHHNRYVSSAKWCDHTLTVNYHNKILNIIHDGITNTHTHTPTVVGEQIWKKLNNKKYNTPRNIQNGESFIKWKNQKLKHIKQTDSNCHILDLVQAFYYCEHVGFNLFQLPLTDVTIA